VFLICSRPSLIALYFRGLVIIWYPGVVGNGKPVTGHTAAEITTCEPPSEWQKAEKYLQKSSRS
jgi:hypothetical protein